MITGKDVEHYAELGRIAITATEKKSLVKDFEKILEYVKKLNEVDTKHVKPMNGGVFFYNRVRSDTVDLERKSDKVNEVARVTRAFPKSKDGYLEVPPVFTE